MKPSRFEGSINPFDLVFDHNDIQYSVNITTDNETFEITEVVDTRKDNHHYIGSYEYTLGALHLSKIYKRLQIK